LSYFSENIVLGTHTYSPFTFLVVEMSENVQLNAEVPTRDARHTTLLLATSSVLVALSCKPLNSSSVS
jgi:hypothetical protein